MPWGQFILSVVAVGQWLGGESTPGGLLYNPAVQALAIVLVILALICDRGWFYIPAMLPGLVLSGSRGAWLILAVGVISPFLNWRSLLLLLLVGAALAVTLYSSSDAERLQIWGLASHGLTLFGHGIGSFADIFYIDRDGLMRHPEHVHDDYLQSTYEPESEPSRSSPSTPPHWGAREEFSGLRSSPVRWRAASFFRVTPPRWRLLVGAGTAGHLLRVAMAWAALLATASDLIAYRGYLPRNQSLYQFGVRLFPLHRIRIGGD